MPPSSRRRVLVASSIALSLSLAVWLGGLVVLGAIVAPIVFRNVPAPYAADAMTLVFRRFDRVAMGASVVVLACEALAAFARLPRTRADLVRVFASAAAALCAVVSGVHLSPRIQALHRGGAVRGLGEEGLELEALHRIAEAAAKLEGALVALAFVLAVLHALRTGAETNGARARAAAATPSRV